MIGIGILLPEFELLLLSLFLLLAARIEEAFRRCWRRPRSASLADAMQLDVEDDVRSAIKPTAVATRDDSTATARRVADDEYMSNECKTNDKEKSRAFCLVERCHRCPCSWMLKLL